MLGKPRGLYLKGLGHLLVAVAVMIAMLAIGTGTSHADSTLEEAFANPGPHPDVWLGVDCQTGSHPQDEELMGDTDTLIFPGDYATSGIQHPIVVWGNGTNNVLPEGWTTCNYDTFLRRLASWGFFVIAPTTGQAGNGIEMLEAAQILIDHNSNPSSPFFQKLDIDNIAMAGHSQGAIGAVNATLQSDSLSDGQVSSVLAVGIGDRSDIWLHNTVTCWLPRPEEPGDLTNPISFGEDCIPIPLPDPAEMNNLGAPIVFVRGAGDLFSDMTPTDWYPTGSVPWMSGSLLGYSDGFTAHLRLIHPCDDHFSQADTCEGETLDDPPGAYGYMSAWLLYTLFDNPLAEAVFAGPTCEISGNSRWADVHSGCLP